MHTRLRNLFFGAVTVSTIGLIGCGSGGSTAVSAKDIVASVEADAASQRGTGVSRRQVSTPATGDDGIIVIGGDPTAQPTPTGQVYVVDQLVGQINGKPVYASEFFRHSEARYRQKAVEMGGTREGQERWLRETRRDIQEALLERVRDEILLAEFRSTLNEEQRRGVLAFIDSIRDDLISGNLGSAALANERLQEEEGLTIDEKVDDMAQQELIYAHISREINRHVRVTDRDVRQYYQQHIDKYQPPPVARLYLISVPTKEAAAIDAVVTGLASGTSPRDLARDPGRFLPEVGGLLESELKNRNYREAQLITNEQLNEAARQLRPGETSERIDLGSTAYWVHLSEIHQPPGRELYDVQLEIRNELRQQRFAEEHERYFKTLLNRANFSDFDEMGNRLFEYAADRFLIRPVEAGVIREASE